MLQNKKYIEFANDNTVEVMALGRLDEGIEKKKKKAGTYKAKDKDGKEVEYLVEWPGLTVADINNLKRSKAGTYNQTGKIPYTSVVDPYTEKELRSLPGGQSSKTIMEAVETAKEQLQEQHGPSLKRSVLKKYGEHEQKVRDVLAKSGAAKGFAQCKKLDKFVKKLGERMQKKAEAVHAELMAAAEAELEQAAELIDDGDLKRAKKILGPLRTPLRKTPLAGRLNELLAKTKPAPAAK